MRQAYTSNHELTAGRRRSTRPGCGWVIQDTVRRGCYTATCTGGATANLQPCIAVSRPCGAAPVHRSTPLQKEADGKLAEADSAAADSKQRISWRAAMGNSQATLRAKTSNGGSRATPSSHPVSFLRQRLQGKPAADETPPNANHSRRSLREIAGDEAVARDSASKRKSELEATPSGAKRQAAELAASGSSRQPDKSAAPGSFLRQRLRAMEEAEQLVLQRRDSERREAKLSSTQPADKKPNAPSAGKRAATVGDTPAAAAEKAARAGEFPTKASSPDARSPDERAERAAGESTTPQDSSLSASASPRPALKSQLADPSKCV